MRGGQEPSWCSRAQLRLARPAATQIHSAVGNSAALQSWEQTLNTEPRATAFMACPFHFTMVHRCCSACSVLLAVSGWLLDVLRPSEKQPISRKTCTKNFLTNRFSLQKKHCHLLLLNSNPPECSLKHSVFILPRQILHFLPAVTVRP